AWLLHNPAVTAPIVGPRTVEQLTDSVRSLDISLSDEIIKRLDDIWPVLAVKRRKRTPGRAREEARWMSTPHSGAQTNSARSRRATTCTSRRFEKTASRTVLRPGSGPWS